MIKYSHALIGGVNLVNRFIFGDQELLLSRRWSLWLSCFRHDSGGEDVLKFLGRSGLQGICKETSIQQSGAPYCHERSSILLLGKDHMVSTLGT